MSAQLVRAHALVAVLVVAGGITSVAAADPPRPGTEDNGLTENESATLWSRDTDDYISQAEYRERYGETRSPVQQVANGTDVTFTQPPATAATWTQHDFRDLDPGGANTSLHPPHADLADGVFIRDAHATMFAVQPSTRAHLDAGETPLYVAPNGTLRGLVDYRVQVPGGATGNTTSDWSLLSHNITAVRLLEGGEPVANTTGSQTPTLAYRLPAEWATTLTLEADIEVRLQHTTRRDGEPVETTVETESVTVHDSRAVEVYDPSVTTHYATYPNGDVGVTVFQARPWQGFTLTSSGDARVRGVWRFYTARNTNWDTLVRATQDGTTAVESDALPVFVHAYPSRIGPRTEPVRRGPNLIDAWGVTRASPAGTLGDNVTVDVVNQSYTTTYGLAVRADDVDHDALQVRGVVRGVNATVTEPADGAARELRSSTLSVRVRDRTPTHATLRLELRDARSGAPIELDDPARRHSIHDASRDGVIAIGDQQVATNASGVAIVTVDDPGIYTARYQPGSWLSHEPAYVSSTATVRWHPLGTLDGWVALLVDLGWRLLPFAVVYYAGTRLLRLLGVDTRFQ
ncbi:hypothetical protein [Halobacterium sp. CBA1126]|uniref:hypothetical protein n=1 Tax=Halobacterium sp. CBA1126 TaxID=2668074 RepID=UPI0012FA5EBB|nr:hypothetical protein [Halobacterium sp. CBA1126]